MQMITRKPIEMELTTECRKQKERSRSRQNREQFRNLIGELSVNVTGSKLSTNKCLMAVSKTFKLSNVSKWISEDFTWKDNRLAQFASISNLLAIEGHLGWAFDSEGYILYVSSNFQKRLNIQGCIIGTHLSKLMPEYDFVLRDLFIDNCQSTCTTIKKKSSKLAFRPSPTPAYMYGKVLMTHQGDKVYVGSVTFYADKSSLHHQNFQYSNTNFAEIVLDQNFEFLKRHKLLEKMQNFSPPLSNFLDSVYPIDLPRVMESFNYATLKKQFNLSYRVKKADSLDSIIVFGQFYMGNTQNGNNVISAFVSPAILDKLDEDELYEQKEEHENIVIKEEKIELTKSNSLSPQGSTSTSDSYSSDCFVDDLNLISSYGNLLPDNDRDILDALDEIFPSVHDDTSTDDDYKDMPFLEMPSYIKCFDS